MEKKGPNENIGKASHTASGAGAGASGAVASKQSRFASSLAGLATVGQARPALRPVVAASVPVRIPFTDEQEVFLHSNHPHLLLSALAGAGKTACLFEYARRRPHQKWSFLVLNRDLAGSLSAAAPPNTKVMTLHSVAFSAFGHLLSSKLREGLLPLPAIERVVSKLFTPPSGLLVALRSGLGAFLASDDLSPMVHHAPLVWQADPDWSPDEWLRALEAIWAASLDPANPLPISHAVYLKRYCQQETPWLSPRWMLDEAQDWPTAVLSAVRRCASVSIRAGDPCQRLYAFRGASLGVWHDPAHEQEYRLVQSHRASAQLEPWVNAALSRLPGGWSWKGRPDLECSIDPRAASESIDQLLAFSPDVILADRWNALESIRADVGGQRTMFRASNQEKASSSAIEISSIHAAKGREFGRVWLPDAVIHTGLSPILSARLSYVAITRATRAVSFPHSLFQTATLDFSEDLEAESLNFFEEDAQS